MATRSLSRKERRVLRQRQAQRRRIVAGAAVLGGVILLAAAAWGWWGDRMATEAALEYGPEDIAYDQPLHAVHEMGPGPSIPYLPSNDPQPSILIQETFYNFGTIGPADVVTHEFVIANVGEATLTISRAYTTCGCTTADFTSSVIPPGKVTIMTLTYDAGLHDVRGQTVRRGVIIENNDPRNSNQEIWVQATVLDGA